MLTLILGGARSGKSRLAQRMAETSTRVVYVATAQACDDAEMADRIVQHRAARPSSWPTVEAPLALADAVRGAEADVVLVDCLTVWLSNFLYEHRDRSSCEDAVHAELARIVEASRDRHVILVSNEVGSGIVPESAVARAFRDAQGRLNQWAAEAADQVILTVAGLPLYVKGGK